MNGAVMDLNAELEQLFPDKRETGETRLKQCQLVMLRMLKIVHFLCERHQIEYFLVGGSLLGAIRHKGFIPWDDDLDIGMTRANYEKFVKERNRLIIKKFNYLIYKSQKPAKIQV